MLILSHSLSFSPMCVFPGHISILRASFQRGHSPPSPDPANEADGRGGGGGGGRWWREGGWDGGGQAESSPGGAVLPEPPQGQFRCPPSRNQQTLLLLHRSAQCITRHQQLKIIGSILCNVSQLSNLGGARFGVHGHQSLFQFQHECMPNVVV